MMLPVALRRRPLLISLGLLAILALALMLRLQPVLSTPETLANGLGPYGDSYFYNGLAVNLARGHGFSLSGYQGVHAVGEAPTQPEYLPAVTRTPLYPIFLMRIYQLFGDVHSVDPQVTRDNYQLARIVQCLLDTLSCLLVFILARAVTGSISVALLAAAIYALSPYHVFYSRALLTETLASFLVVLAALITVVGYQKPQRLFQLMIGMLWGLLALCRPEYLPFALAVPVYLLLFTRSTSGPAMRALMALLGLVLVVGPWMARNHALIDRPALSVGGPGISLFIGTFEVNAEWLGEDAYFSEAFDNPQQKAEVLELFERYAAGMRSGTAAVMDPDQQLWRIAAARILERPLSTLMVWLKRAPRLWFQGATQRYRDAEPSGVLLLVCLGFAGFALLRSNTEQRARLWPLWLLPLYVACVYLPLHVEPRYSLPAISLVMVLASVGCIQIIEGIRARLQR